MNTKTYRVKSMQEALRLIRRDLGPDASVLHTREVSGGLLRWMVGSRQLEVTASREVSVPSRIPQAAEVEPTVEREVSSPPTTWHAAVPPAHEIDYRSKFRNDLKTQSSDLPSMMDKLGTYTESHVSSAMPESLFQLFTELIDAEVSEELAREFIDRVKTEVGNIECEEAESLKARIARWIEDEITTCGPVRVTSGKQRIAALIGPTGVGKTTTIAKLAANFRLRDRCRVGLITVDTYRIAAVEQLRTYADIMDLPMEVVSTPREMRQAIERFDDLDLILLDTAGRSPRDEVKIQELKSMLAEAQPDEVHLVLSVVAGTSSLKKTAVRFAEAGATALILTKLDESHSLGNLLPLVRSCRLPLSYTTNGQNVPDDIAKADKKELAKNILGVESQGTRV